MMTVKVLILQNFNAPNGRSFTAEQEATMDAAEAKEYERAGYLRILNLGLPAVKVMSKPKKAANKSVKGN